MVITGSLILLALALIFWLVARNIEDEDETDG